MQLIMHEFGSNKIPGVLRNLLSDLNGIKAKMWAMQAPISTTKIAERNGNDMTLDGYNVSVSLWKQILYIWDYFHATMGVLKEIVQA
ncbi:hypothetical protein Micbo1qcDRAFT_169851, partial [Microdochium bolleyi]